MVWTLDVARVTLALALMAAWPGPPAAAGTGTLILYDGVASEAQVQAHAAALAERLKLGASDRYRVEFLADAVFGGADHWPEGVRVRFCPSGTMDVDLEIVVPETEAMAAEGRFAEAEAALAAALGELACITPPVSPAALARASLLLGWMRVELQDRQGAKEAFAMATTFDPEVEWYTGYPAHAQQVFVFAAKAALAAGDTFFDAGTAEDDVDRITIDGVRLAERHRLRPGWHQLSVPTRDGGRLRLAVELLAGGRTRLVDSRELLEMFLVGEDDSRSAGRAIAAVMARSGDEVAYLVEPALNRVFRFDRETLELTELPVWEGAPWRPQGQRP